MRRQGLACLVAILLAVGLLTPVGAQFGWFAQNGGLIYRTSSSGPAVTIVQSGSGAALSVTGPITTAQGTLTADGQAISTTATWNSGGTTFTHWLGNVTDTASAAASKLIDLKVGGSSKFSVTKAGAVTSASTGEFSGLLRGVNLETNNASGYVGITSRSIFTSPANGTFRITNYATTNYLDVVNADWGTALTAEAVSYAADAVQNIGVHAGVLTLTIGTANNTCKFVLNGSSGTLAESSDTAFDAGSLCTVTKGNAGTVNVSWQTDHYEIENKIAGTRTISAIVGPG